MEKAGGKTSRHGVSESGVFQDTVTKGDRINATRNFEIQRTAAITIPFISHLN